MLVLVDTNIALDWLLEREPWFTADEPFWQRLDDGQITGYITATTLTDIFYITRRLRGRQIAYTAIRESLSAFEVVAVDVSVQVAGGAWRGALPAGTGRG
jgi:predicted nucleic acid-binding protein